MAKPKQKRKKESSHNKELTIIRTFNAPRRVVFRAWTDPELLAQWWGPKDFTNPVCEWEARPGGAIRVHMTAPNGTVYPMGGVVREVKDPERIVFISTALGDEESVDLENLNTVVFEDDGGRTKATVHVEVLKAAPVMARALDGMEIGWCESLDKLESLVGK